MGGQGLVMSYLHSCTSGALRMSDCGPIWQLGVIVVLLLGAIITLALLQLRRPQGPS